MPRPTCLRVGAPQRVLTMTLAVPLWCALGCQSEVPDTTIQLTPPVAAVAGAPAVAPSVPADSAPKPRVTTAPSVPTTTPAAAAPATAMPASTPAAPASAPAASMPAEKPVESTPATEPEATQPEEPASEPAQSGFVRGPMPTRESAARVGSFKVQQYSDGFRDGSEFRAATIYYPEDAQPPFAMIVFCPGYLSTQADDAKWGPFMASHGMVFMIIDTNTVGDSVLQRKAAELDALESLKGEHTRAGSPLEGKLALDRVSLMGWSMGGGGAWLNGIDHPEIKTVVTLTGHHATAGGAEPVRGLTVPTLMLAGTADTAILGLGMSQPIYDVIPESTPKLLYEVEGASHFDFNDPAFAEGIPARYALSWQKVFLEEDKRYYDFLLEEGKDASDFRTNLK
jgi:predicted dienelactone hydrolase